MAQADAQWLQARDDGLYVAPADLWIDPVQPKARAVITHGHGDHARPGHGAVLATPATAAIMRARYGAQAAGRFEDAAYGVPQRLGGVDLTLRPAGHVLGSAQVVLDHGGRRAVVSGDYKRRDDPTCAAFEPVACDLFVTEATFALPVFRHPPIGRELDKLFASMARFPERSHLLGVYALGKAQRLIAELRARGYDREIFLHGALKPLCRLYEDWGVALGPLADATAAEKHRLRGQLVLAPPAATRDRWARRLDDPVVAHASGWMTVRQRAKQRLAELPLIVSDHADWDELTATVVETGCETLWVTHGREDALVHWARGRGIDARALSLVGREDEDADP
ncbi:DNA ligase-associated DEXH box helicase [Rhodothalassium salexigens]|uniref:ligase-associated DNA damage response exonuclease n=1 Tax=Rhodothalassium salexigens TaxID=1086 RepID=UPI0019125587|nr:ligase-associated DNA damage response exonuclease [Rhodothalassium salexigens]MBK5912414.1 DNA ligase-associated DEXH box helicase [Rhodothalassium salexigens]